MSREEADDAMNELLEDYLYLFTGSREYSLWGGYQDGSLQLASFINGMTAEDWANFDISDWDIEPGSIEAILALGYHDIMRDMNLVNAIDAISNLLYEYPSKQCTAWAMFFQRLMTGKIYLTHGQGNGNEMAKTLVRDYSDWEYSPYPVAGSIFSCSKFNHVVFISKVEGDKVWFCDGNCGGSTYNTRLNVCWTMSDFIGRFGTGYTAHYVGG